MERQGDIPVKNVLPGVEIKMIRMERSASRRDSAKFTSGIPTLLIVCVFLATLKMIGVLDISWWLAMLPILVPLSLTIAIVIIVAIYVISCSLIMRIRERQVLSEKELEEILRAIEEPGNNQIGKE